MGQGQSQLGLGQFGQGQQAQVTACPDGYSAIRSRQPVCVPAQAECGQNLVWNAQLGACTLPPGALAAPAAAQFAQQYPQAAQAVQQEAAQQYLQDAVQQYGQAAVQQWARNAGLLQ